MFRSARFKLTTWYLLIIMFISLIFSFMIYHSIAFELGRRFNRIEYRLRAEGMRLPPPMPMRPHFFAEDLEFAKKRVLIILFYINGVILILSGAAGYFLAGKTLKPIEEAMEEQKRFVSDASHELRTPLAALKTSIEVALREKKMTMKEAVKVLKSSLEDIDNLQKLTDDLLSLAQNEKNESLTTFSEVDIAEAINHAYKSVQPLAKRKGVTIAIEAKKHFVEGDSKSLEKLMTIFLDNAVKYTPRKGRVAVITREDHKNVVVEIKDTGIGIDKKDIPHIFDRFYRVEQSRSKTKVPGFGLGLSIAKKIVDLHNGSINVTSALGKGTSFIIKLPFKQARV